MDVLGALEPWTFDLSLEFRKNPGKFKPTRTIPFPAERRINYGNPGEDPTRTLTFEVPEGNRDVTVDMVISGHGLSGLSFDVRDAGEFFARKNTVFIDGEPHESLIWRDDCGEPHGIDSPTPEHPLEGNFHGSRSGWCPGDFIQPWHIDVGPLAPGEHTMTWQPEQYVNRRPYRDYDSPYWGFSGAVTLYE
jgi:hypothetical protein